MKRNQSGRYGYINIFSLTSKENIMNDNWLEKELFYSDKLIEI